MAYLKNKLSGITFLGPTQTTAAQSLLAVQEAQATTPPENAPEWLGPGTPRLDFALRPAAQLEAPKAPPVATEPDKKSSLWWLWLLLIGGVGYYTMRGK